MSKRGRKKDKRKDRTRKRQSWEGECQQIRDSQANAPQMKRLLRQKGCELPFYDFLDSYEDEFQRIADAAKTEHASLLGIHEVDDQTYSSCETDWSKLGYTDLQQIFFDIKEVVPDYGRKGTDENMCGFMSAFLDADRNVRSVILIRRTVKISQQHREFKYAFKIASLLHEIGHVHDLEHGVNFDVATNRLSLIEAEVFAHLYCLEHLARRNLLQSFQMVEGGLKDAIPKGGYLSEVAQKVLERMPSYQLTDWQQVLDQVL